MRLTDLSSGICAAGCVAGVHAALSALLQQQQLKTTAVSAGVLAAALFAAARALHPHLPRRAAAAKAAAECLLLALFAAPPPLLCCAACVAAMFAFGVCARGSLRGHSLAAAFGVGGALLQPQSAFLVAACACFALIRESSLRDPAARGSLRGMLRWCVRSAHVAVSIAAPYAVVCTAFAAFSLTAAASAQQNNDGGQRQLWRHPSLAVYLPLWLLFTETPTLAAFFVRWLRAGAVPTRDPRTLLPDFAVLSSFAVVALLAEGLETVGLVVMMNPWSQPVSSSSWLLPLLFLAPASACAALLLWHLLGRQTEALWWRIYALFSVLYLVVPRYPSSRAEISSLALPMLLLHASISPPPDQSPNLAVLGSLLLSSVWSGFSLFSRLKHTL